MVNKVLQPGLAAPKAEFMTRFDQISATIDDSDGVVVLVAGPDEKFQVHLLKSSAFMTEAAIERHIPLIFHQVMIQRMQNVSLPAGREITPHATIAEETEDDFE